LTNSNKIRTFATLKRGIGNGFLRLRKIKKISFGNSEKVSTFATPKGRKEKAGNGE
jgi:hypothetical protein